MANAVRTTLHILKETSHEKNGEAVFWQLLFLLRELLACGGFSTSFIFVIMNIDNQTGYWNKVAFIKTFTHPIDVSLIEKCIDNKGNVLDYGCGYGRLTKTLHEAGFKNVTGVDTSEELVKRGKHAFPDLNLFHIENAQSMPVEVSSIDLVLLFAILTCIPSNAGQKELISILYDKLKKGGFIYISDYYLQLDRAEVKDYGDLENDIENYGVFTLGEGVTFRHHTEEWIKKLLKDFVVVSEKRIAVKTMNGHLANSFQIIAKK
jgi:SAM-dependent methyltransferase